ncbi:hypothetical protein CEXT_463831 [Caerostris extrusa]|uniref:Uncharacterized protein n=1 Tax=Caerostris extrusa TaxID=172846 RepID=A0AAV4NTB6_CAEEX|nr:hypothetical protein CEXT_463831 [Caerostris extrusa]
MKRISIVEEINSYSFVKQLFPKLGNKLVVLVNTLRHCDHSIIKAPTEISHMSVVRAAASGCRFQSVNLKSSNLFWDPLVP